MKTRKPKQHQERRALRAFVRTAKHWQLRFAGRQS